MLSFSSKGFKVITLYRIFEGCQVEDKPIIFLVHVCTIDEDGHIVLSAQARLMTEAEISKYGPLLKSYDPKVRFRP